MTAQPTTLPDLISASDESLAASAHSSTTAFAELYHRHFHRVYRYHMVRTGNVQDSQDLTTQTFLAALENIHSYRKTGSFSAWLLGIARNKVAMHYRSLKHTAGLEAAEDIPDSLPLPEAIAGRRLELAQVSRALRRLTPEQASAITLCIFCELSAAEAGQVMEKSEAAVKMLLMRGLQALRERLAPPQAGDAPQEDK